MKGDPRISGITLGIMQPYFFPYLGYYQYMAATDRFVIYDDVQFIMRGWINRNRILVQGNEHMFTVPLTNASPNRSIRDVLISHDQKWREPLKRTLHMAYSRAPHFDECMDIIMPVIESDTSSISMLATESLAAVIRELNIDTEIVPSSTVYENSGLDRTERLIDICIREGATACVVPIGGASMYPKDVFMERGITLHYLSPRLVEYGQYGTSAFVPSLSIIDPLMRSGLERTADMIRQGELV